jgi:hypothetical protein
VIVSFAGFALLPALLSVVLPLLPTGASQPYVVLVLLIPTLTYLFAQLGLADRPDPARDRRHPARWAPGLPQVLGGCVLRSAATALNRRTGMLIARSDRPGAHAGSIAEGQCSGMTPNS